MFAPTISTRVAKAVMGKTVSAITHFGQAVVIRFESGEILHIFASDEGAHSLHGGLRQKLYPSLDDYEKGLEKSETKDIAYGGPRKVIF